MLKIDPKGNVLWERAVGDQSQSYHEVEEKLQEAFKPAIGPFASMIKFRDKELGVAATGLRESGYVILGERSYAGGLGGHAAILVRLSVDGSSYTREVIEKFRPGRRLIANGDGGVLLAGSKEFKQAGEASAAVIMFEADRGMKVKWRREYGRKEQGVQVVDSRRLPSEGYVLLAESGAYGGESRQLHMLWLNEDGRLRTQKSYSPSQRLSVYAMAITESGDALLLLADGKIAYVQKIDALGNMQWRTAIDYVDEWGGSGDVAITSTGACVVALQVVSTATRKAIEANERFVYSDFRMLLAQINVLTGEIEWRNWLEDSKILHVGGLSIRGSGELVVTGGESSRAGGEDIYVVQLDSLGMLR